MFAPFVHLDWQFADRWQLTAGIRFEQMKYDYQNLMLAGRTRDDGTSCGFGGCRYSRPEDSKDSFDNWSPKLGLGYQLDDSLLFLNISHGFRAPQATELYRLQRQQSIADLDSEEINSFELGIRRSASTLSYEFVFYQMDKDNVIYRDSNYYNLSNGKTEHQGIEFAVDYALSEYFTIGLNGSLAKHQYSSDQFLGDININGNDVDTAPKHFGSIQLDWNISSGLNLQFEWLHQGAYYMDAENLHQYDGHNLVNLRANWRVTNQWLLFARINNRRFSPAIANSGNAQKGCIIFVHASPQATAIAA